MSKGFCSTCIEVLTKENTCPSIFKRGTGKCHLCDNARCKIRYRKDPEKFSKRGKEWIKNNWPKRQEINKRTVATRREREFGITQEQFDFKVAKQSGLCEICKQPMLAGVRNRTPCQDHNHITSELRDILCSSCNLMLGNCFENKEILANAIQYLQKHESGSSTQTAREDSRISSVTP